MFPSYVPQLIEGNTEYKKMTVRLPDRYGRGSLVEGVRITFVVPFVGDGELFGVRSSSFSGHVPVGRKTAKNELSLIHETSTLRTITPRPRIRHALR